MNLTKQVANRLLLVAFPVTSWGSFSVGTAYVSDQSWCVGSFRDSPKLVSSSWMKQLASYAQGFRPSFVQDLMENDDTTSHNRSIMQTRLPSMHGLRGTKKYSRLSSRECKSLTVMDVRGFYGYPWISMDINIHEYPCISVGIHWHSWIGGWGWEGASNQEIVSFDSFVRAPGRVVKWKRGPKARNARSFPLFSSIRSLRFPFFLSHDSVFGCFLEWFRCEFEDGRWHRSETEVKSKWNRNKTKGGWKWSRSGFEVRSK